KPENVMVVGDDYNTKVMDFGLAYIRGQSRITSDGIISGSAYYMAPEVAEGKTSDHRGDLYALGVMLYEMLAGRLPFYSENHLAVISQHLYDAPAAPSTFNPHISNALEAILLKLLAKHPEDRFQEAGAVRKALLNLEADTQEKPTRAALLNKIIHSPIIGRETEWVKLRDYWQRVRVGAVDAPALVLIAGEAGSGKSQLANQLIVKAQQAGAKVLTGLCYQNDSALPYRPFSDMLRDALRDSSIDISPAIVADLAKLVPEVAEEHAAESLPSLPVEAERVRLFEHITQYFIELSHARPLLLFIDDLHWADASSIALLHYLAPRLREQPIFVLGTYRQEELNPRHPLDALLREFTSRNLVERIVLRRVSHEDMQKMVESILGVQIGTQLADVIYEKTEGNLFFARELLKSLVLEETIYEDQGVWKHKELTDVELPSSIVSVIGQQLSKLSEAAHEVLTVAAVIGRQFAFDVLAEAVDYDEETLLKALEEAADGHLIHESSSRREDVYIFENSAIRQTLLSDIGQRRKARLHMNIARALESRYRNTLQDYVEVVARHYSLGARTDDEINRALDYLLQAAGRASEVFALPNAVDLYTQALDLAQEDASERRNERLVLIRERRGMVYQKMGHFEAAAADLEGVLQTPEVQQDAYRKRRVLLELGQVYRRGEQFEAAIKRLTDAVELSRTMNDERLVADALFYLGAMYWSRGNIAIAMRHQQEAYEIVTRLGLQDEVTMRVLHGVGECAMRRSDYAILKAAEDSYELARQFGNIEYQIENLTVLGMAEMHRGNYERAQEILAKQIQLGEQADIRWHRMFGMASYGWAKAAAGDYSVAIQILEDAKRSTQERYKGVLMTMLWDYLGRCYLELEDLPRAVEAFSAGMDCVKRYLISWSEAATIANWSLAQIRSGNLEVGTLLLDTLEKTLSLGDMLYVPFLHQSLCALELARHQPEKAALWAEKMVTMADKLDQTVQVAWGHLWWGRALVQSENLIDARTHFENGMAIAMTINRPRLMWDLHQAQADLYAALGDEKTAQHHRERVHLIIQSLADRLKETRLRDHLLRKLS
ncbi:MAG: AAA family ATPase, partial [Anaerolineae bacterium]|nr:AAA family ATPase [Anaerolineae bacterium]